MSDFGDKRIKKHLSRIICDRIILKQKNRSAVNHSAGVLCQNVYNTGMVILSINDSCRTEYDRGSL
jgi:hypothetical protein